MRNRFFRGFSLAEVLVAIFLLTVPLLALVSSQIFGLKALQKSGARQTASVLAVNAMAQAERDLWSHFETDLDQERQKVEGFENFEYKLTTRLESPSLKRVKVEVFWTETGSPQTYELETKFVKE